ncbi:zinc finger and SCAN domain-containing protein 12-like [Hyposmocoma kahamanoa]|uniref:zinc finger and SCAN domain-containing protein 12-like n=1 Tax=Hyposmocoma kahamanoa TaxID=1477025 RepID=UPI000E6D7EAD|nr:zinc finger and SCAN domain-containing protein 12-like [Hyposmocoma kahamanoa]
MDEYSESQSKMLCCICLIRDRKLIQLCRLKDGVNNFYSLLFSDAEAYREGFFKDTASLFICWEYKCSQCDKGYRSRGELRDHVNYQHMGKTQHKCPVCSKALATRRCITRHVRRAHHGVKENARDKICQQCGKAFRDKKGLREHEFIHTGERPLSCEICGRTFRQTASLYTHRKRVHHVYPMKKQVELLETTESQQNNVS